jgi:ribonuclease P protein component
MSEEDLPTQQPAKGEAPRLPPPHGDARRAGDPQGSPAEGPPSAVGLIWRIHGRTRFEEFRRARRARSGPLTVAFLPSHAPHPPEIAWSIGRKVGPATVRNRLRRQLRAAARLMDPPMRPGSYLVSVRPEAVGLRYAQLAGHLSSATRAASGSAAP